MPEFIRQRTTHVIALWREGRWRKWLGLGWTVLSVFIVFRDDFWMPADTQKWRAINMIPRVSLKAWIIGTLILVVAFMFEASYRHAGKLADRLKAFDVQSPLEIIFDTHNPARRFWSMEQAYNELGMPNGAFWEHRVEIRNNSLKTLRNVSVTTAHLGQMPMRPVNQPFDKIKKTTCNLQPGCTELVPVTRWPIPKVQEGMLAGSSALEYGPIKVTASADDTVPVTRLFHFDWQTDQMLFDEKPISDHQETQISQRPVSTVAL